MDKRHCANKKHRSQMMEVSSQPAIMKLVGIQSDTRIFGDQVMPC